MIPINYPKSREQIDTTSYVSELRDSQPYYQLHFRPGNSLLWGPVLCTIRRFASIPGLCPLDANDTIPQPLVVTKKVSNTAKCPLWSKTTPGLRNTNLAIMFLRPPDLIYREKTNLYQICTCRALASLLRH